MSVNSFLCIGRSDMLNAKSVNRRVNKVNAGVSTVPTDMNDVEFKLDLHEPRILPVTPRKSTRRDGSPPTKSILRSKSPCSNNGSPCRDRNVRFCDKQHRTNCGEFSKLHVNECVQTDNGYTKEDRGTQIEIMASTKLDLTKKPMLTRPKPLPYQSKTSTPRYSPSKSAPDVNFDHSDEGNSSRSRSPLHSPIRRSRSPSKDNGSIKVPKCKNGTDWKQSQKFQSQFLNQNYDPSQYRNKHGVNRNKSVSVATQTAVSVATQTGSGQEEVSDGNRIIRNLDLSASPRSLSPVPKVPEISDGHRIIQNMELSHCIEKYRSEATQTDNESDWSNESLRSQSPDFEFSATPDMPSFRAIAVQTGADDAPDGNRIIQNIELSMGESSFNDSRTEDSLSSKSKSESTQVNMDELETEEEPLSRSIAIQATAEPEPIPDGSSIVKNMALKSVDTFQTHEPKVNDPKWNDFLKSLDKQSANFSPEGSTNGKVNEPVIIYDKTALKEHERAPLKQCKTAKDQPHIELKPCERLSEHSARQLLESDAFTKRQIEDVFRTYDSKRDSATSRTATLNMFGQDKYTTDKSAAASYTTKPKIPDRNAHVPTLTMRTSGNHHTQHLKSDLHLLTWATRNDKSDVKEVSCSNTRNQSPVTRQERSNSLGFTPIETYSFNPDSLARSALNLQTCRAREVSLGQSIAHEPTLDYTPADNLSKNAIILGLDLGPEPPVRNPKTSRSPSRGRVQDTLADRSKQSHTRRIYGRPSHQLKQSENTHLSRSKDYPSYKSYFDDGRNSRSDGIRRSASLNSRPSSAPTYKSRRPYAGTSLTPSLNTMRNKAAWKYSSENSGYVPIYLDVPLSTSTNKKRESLKGRSTSSGRVSRYDSFKYQRDTSNISHEDALLKQWALPSKYAVPRQSTSPTRCTQRLLNTLEKQLHANRNLSPGENTYMYTDALHDRSNKRLSSSRETSPNRARSIERRGGRSSSRSPMRPYRDTSTDADREVKRLTCMDSSDNDSCVSIETSCCIKQKDQKVSHRPPLPRTKLATSPLLDQRKDSDLRASGSSKVYGREPIKTATNVRDSHSRSPIASVNDGRAKSPLHQKTKPEIDQNTITIGNAPDGVENKSCVFLGHDTIQKIIENANLA